MRATCLCAGVMALLLLLAGCGGGGGAPADAFTYGAGRQVALTAAAGQVVDDPASGLTFVLPEGAVGTLTLMPIQTAPVRPMDGGAGVSITAPAGTHVQVRVPVAADEDAYLFVFGRQAGSIQGGPPRDQRWVPVPDMRPEAGAVLFDLPADPTRLGDFTADTWMVRKQRTAQPWPPRAQVQADVATVLGMLPEPQKTNAADRISSIGYTVIPSNDYFGSFYSAFGWYFPSQPAPRFLLRSEVSRSVIAHEVGHYMTHMLAGDTAYKTIENLAPDENHGLAVVYAPRQTITEEYAYFMQYALTGHIDSGDPAVGGWVGTLLRKTAAEVDYPSVEGFGCSLMAACTRQADGQAVDFTRQRIATPAGALTTADVIALYAKGHSNIGGLQQALEDEMALKGKANAFRVIAERLGWSYHAKGKLLLADNTPAAGVTLQPEIKAEDGVTYTVPAITTDAQGNFALPRVFPGKFTLRATSGADSYAVDYDFGWDRETTTEVTLPDWKLPLVEKVITGSFARSDDNPGAFPAFSVTVAYAVTGVTPSILPTAQAGRYSVATRKGARTRIELTFESPTLNPTEHTHTFEDGSFMVSAYRAAIPADTSRMVRANDPAVPVSVSLAGNALTVEFTLTSHSQSVDITPYFGIGRDWLTFSKAGVLTGSGSAAPGTTGDNRYPTTFYCTAN